MLGIKRFQSLERRESALRARFLKWNPVTNKFGRPAKDEIRAYCLLIHAEVEAYIEQVARDGIERSKRLLNKRNVANGVLFSLVASSHNLFLDDAIDPDDRLASDRFNRPQSKSEWVELCGAQGHQVIGSNNGIKAKDIKAMFRPLGLDMSALDQTWLADMTQLGTDRGNIAHSTIKMQTIPNLSDLCQRVDRIIQGCGVLREEMSTTCQVSIPAHVALAETTGGG